jgi:HPt (histidine-containing phosphotransfer) domain-containing protein
MGASRRRSAKGTVNQLRDWLASSLGSQLSRLRLQGLFMPSRPRLDPIPSPPLVVSDDAIDVEHLARMTLGDDGLMREVLAMFLSQTSELLGQLAARPGDGAAQAHTLTGSARAIGAFRVAVCAESLERAISQGVDLSRALAELQAEVAEACALIEVILAQP